MMSTRPPSGLLSFFRSDEEGCDRMTTLACIALRSALAPELFLPKPTAALAATLPTFGTMRGRSPLPGWGHGLGLGLGSGLGSGLGLGFG